jgi:adenylylsulfate kinase-like enzyme
MKKYKDFLNENLGNELPINNFPIFISDKIISDNGLDDVSIECIHKSETPKQYFIFMVGCPGSGKSTWAKSFLKSMQKVNNFKWGRVNMDSLRKMISGDYEGRNKDINAMAHIGRDNLCKQFLENGYNVIVDDTNVFFPDDLFRSLKSSFKDVSFYKIYMNSDLDTCIERDSQREGFEKVGKDVILKFHNKLSQDRK